MSNQDQKYYDFLPSVVAAMERPPKMQYRLVSWIIMAFVVIALLWLCLAKVDIVVSAQGKIVPAGKVKVLQASEEGVVKAIFVRDGQLVKSGDALIEMDGTATDAERQQLDLKLSRAQLTVQRLRAELGEQVKLGDGVSKSGISLATETELYAANQKAFKEQVSLLGHDLDQSHAATVGARNEVARALARVTHLKTRLQQRTQQAKKGLVAGQEVADVRFELETAEKDLQVAYARVAENEALEESSMEKLQAAQSNRDRDLYTELSEAEHGLKSVEQDLIKLNERISVSYTHLTLPTKRIV